MFQAPPRGIEWSLRALASMRAVRLFLQARAVIKYVLRAASTLKNTDGEQRALRKFSRWNLDFSLLKRNVLRHAIWLLPLNQSPSCLQPIAPCWRWCQITSFSFAECGTLVGGRSKRSKPTSVWTYHGKKLRVTRLSSFVTESFGYINILWKCDQAFRTSLPISWQTDWLKKIQRNGSFIQWRLLGSN